MDKETQVLESIRASAPVFQHYVAIGDSLSEGLGDPVGGAQLKGWANYLAEQLRAVSPSMRFTNLAVRGHTTSRAVATQLDAAIAAEPDLVSVFIGGNDVLFFTRFEATRFAGELDELVEPFVAPGVTVVLSTLPDLTACSLLLPPLRGALRRRIVAANDVIRDAADRHQTSCSTPGPMNAPGVTPCGAWTGSTRAPRDIASSPRAWPSSSASGPTGASRN